MHRRVLLAVVVSALALALASPVAATPPLPGEVIAAGVTANGLDVSGKTVAEAAQLIDAYFRPHLERNVVVRVASKTYKLTAVDAGLVFDSEASAKRALYAGRDLVLAPPAPNGGVPSVDVPLALSHDSVPVTSFAQLIAHAVARPGRDATLKLTLRHVAITHSVSGRAVDAAALAHDIGAALDDARASRLIKPTLIATPAAVTYAALRKTANTVITVDRAHFKLRLFKNLKLRKSYGVAVGQPIYPTPTGRFAIQDKQVNPVWSVPNSPWAGELAGTTVTGGSAANPLKARWMGIANGVGIHGTGEDASIGSAASHGCIRMHVADVIDLFGRVPIGTPVLIK